MAVVHLGLNSKSEYLVYEDTPIFISSDDIHNIQGSMDVRTVIETIQGGIMLQGKAFSNIPNLNFHLNKTKQKSVKSTL